jgi:hypothetical protein
MNRAEAEACTILRGVRRGEFTQNDVLNYAAYYERTLKAALDSDNGIP